MKKILLSLFLLNIVVLTGCVSSSNTQRINIVTTTTMIADLTNVIGKQNVEVSSLMSTGVDPHDYTASAQDLTKLTNADIVIYNGINLESKMSNTLAEFDNVICLEDAFDSSDLLYDEYNVADPHIWFDISLWDKAAYHVANQLSTIDNENKDYYYNNYLDYKEELSLLEYYVLNRVSEVDVKSRYLITAHDAFNYFGNAYGFTVRGILGTSTSDEASTSDFSLLASIIVENDIKAIFNESSVNDKNILALKAAVNSLNYNVVVCEDKLYSDSLGDSSLGHGTYISSFKANVDIIVGALKGVLL